LTDLKRSYSPKTLKVLFALSGNQCAHPECKNALIEPATEQSDIHVSAHICHIYAISTEGPRGKSGLTQQQLNAPENLILLCSHHHGIVDGQYETYPADMLKEWKRTHESKMQERLSADLETVQPDVFSHPYFPTTLVDQKIEEEVETLRKTRFFGESDSISKALVLARRSVEGELAGGTDPVRSRALAWCARLLARSPAVDKAEEYLKLAKSLRPCAEIKIAEAFIISQKGEKAAALKILAPLDSPLSRSAALMIVAHHESADGAIKWLTDAKVETNTLDSDGKFFLLGLQLELARWEGAVETIEALTELDFASSPALRHLAAIARLVAAVPTEYRSSIVTQIPFNADNFPLASDALGMEARRTAQRCFVEAAKVERDLDCPRVAMLDDEYALWLELRDPETADKGRERLQDKLRDPKFGLRLVPLGLQFDAKLDLSAVEQAIEQQIALHGGITPDAAIARFALAFTQKSPQDIANYIERHYDDLSKFLDKKFVVSLQIEALSRAGMPDKAEERLSLLLKEGLPEEDEARLRGIISAVAGADSVELRKDQFSKTDSLNDLLVLVDELELRQSWDELCDFGESLFQRTRSVADAERLANALTNSQKSDRLVEFLKAFPGLREQSRKLQMFYCWALYDEGHLTDTRSALSKLSDEPDDRNYRALTVNLGIALGDWVSLSAFVAAEYQARDKRSPQDLIQTARLAHHLGSPHARDLTYAAAAKGDDDPITLAAAYFLATTAGWEDDRTVFQWLHKAAELSGEHGPIQRMTLKDLVERKPDWDRRESETWQMLTRGDAPIFLAGELLNKSLINLMLFPALTNLSVQDPRRRGAIPAYSGKRRPLPLDTTTTAIGMDATALLTLSFLNLLDKALDAFSTVYVPHSTLSWLFEEKQKAAFHQPSRIRDAHKVRNMLATNALQKFVPSTVADSDLSAQVGDDLSMLIAEAEKARDGDQTQRIVVRPSPVHRLGSLLGEEADLTGHAGAISSCLAIVEKLRQKGQITADEEKNARAYLQLHEKPWPQQPIISDGAVLYLDDLAISYFLHLGILEKLKAAGFVAIASPSEVSDTDALISYESITGNVDGAIERIRSAINSRIESGKIKVGRRRKVDEPEERSIADHPTVASLALAEVCSALVIDDRFFNQHGNINEGGRTAAVFSTLDLLDGLALAGVITPDHRLESRTLLRRGGYFFIPVGDDELTQHLRASSVSGGKLSETAELKAIRENLLRVRMSEWLQLPKEAPWLDSTIKVFVAVLRRIWKSGTDIATIKTLSDWIVDQIDIRGWIHRLGPDVGNDILTTGRGAYILLLLMPPSEVPREVKDAYWEWVEDRVLAQIKDEVPNLYHWIVERQKQMIFELADTDLNEGSSS
jgi:hypothetical protein